MLLGIDGFVELIGNTNSKVFVSFFFFFFVAAVLILMCTDGMNYE